MRKILSILGLIAALTAPVAGFAQNRVTFAGVAAAKDFAYGVTPNVAPLLVTAGSTGTGSYSVTVAYGRTTTSSGVSFVPLSVTAPVTIGGGTNMETVTPSAVSCPTPAVQYSCSFTATFTYAHGNGDQVRSGSFGLQEALNYAPAAGIGEVAIDGGWTALGGTNAILIAAVVQPNVAVADHRSFTPTYWNPVPGASTVLGTPTTLTAVTALPSATPVGAYGTGTYHMCISYVDLMGNEGPCSADFSEAGLATGSFIFSPPAASAGAVGYTIYISLTSGTYTLAYKVPLTAAVCTLTSIETATAACAVTNSTYGQTGATATVTAITVSTSPTAINSGVISTTAITHGNANGKAGYIYGPASKVALGGIQGAIWPYPTAAAAATTVPSVLGTVQIPVGYMNAVGRTIRVCGYGTMSGASTATVLELSLQWDAFGQNTAGLPVTIADAKVTPAAAFAASVVNTTFCFTVSTQIAGATATGGTVIPTSGYITFGNTAPGVSATSGPIITTAAVGSLNLAGEARLHIVYTHVTGTDGAGFILNGVTVEAL